MKTRRVIHTIFTLTIFLSAIIFNSCSDDSNPAAPQAPSTAGLFRLDSVFAIGGRASVSVYLKDSLHTGYNPVYIVLYDSVTKALITDAHVEFSLLNHTHGSPVENPGKL